MKYPDRQQVKLSDGVQFGANGPSGRVVGIVDADEYEGDFRATEWSYLATGVLIESDKYGLIHFPSELDSDIVLVSRAT